MLEKERLRRQYIWSSLLSAGGPIGVSPFLLRLLGIYNGYQGIWVDKRRTGPLTLNGYGITVSLLHTGKIYPHYLSSSGIIFHYPKTNRPPSRDLGEIEATKNAHRFSLPVFIISRSSPLAKVHDVHLGWVEGWDDNSQEFLVTFLPEETNEILVQPKDDAPFIPQEGINLKTTTVKTRPDQQRFSFLVLQRYGEKCAVCDLDIPELLEAAHIIPKKHNGTDDPRNGLVLCSLHHRALDSGLFCIDPLTLNILFKSDGPQAEDLRIIKKNLNHLRNLPHNETLTWLKQYWKGKVIQQ